MAASAALIWVWGRGLTLFDDEWGYALRIATEPASTYLINPPAGKHLIAVPLLFYKAAFELWGISSDAPYQVAHIVLLLLCAGLFFVLARRRVGDLLAVMATSILLFLGPAREVVATPLRIPSLISAAAGLGMLLLLERRDLRGDIGACLLLGVSLASLSTGYPFAAAAAVLVLARSSPERWRRAWVFAIPVALYLAWWLLEFDIGPDAQPLGRTLIDLPVYLGKSLAVSVLSVTGLVLTNSTGELFLPVAFYVVLGAALLALLAWAVVARSRRPAPLSPFIVSMAAALLVFWTATAFAPGPERVPWASRYLYLDAVLLLLLVCELARGLDVPRRLTRTGWAVISIAFVISIAGNVRELRHEMGQLVEDSDYIRAGLTSLQIAGDNVAPTFRLDTALSPVSPRRTSLLGAHLDDNGLPLGHLTAYGYRSVFDKYGSPAYSPAELPSKSPELRRAADTVLVRALLLRLHPIETSVRGTAPAPKPLVPDRSAWRTERSGCVKLPPSSTTSSAMVQIATAGAAIEAGSGPVTVTVGRFADGTPVQLGTVPANASSALLVPADAPGQASPVRWRIGLGDANGATVCSLGGARP
ncbi:MAG: hypothetical protein ACJ75I_04915 [Solirubrobacterales bacterium]